MTQHLRRTWRNASSGARTGIVLLVACVPFLLGRHDYAIRLTLDRDRVIATGDSGNDRDMLNRGFKSIIVSNHTPDLDDLAGTPNLYFAQNPAALGVLEGLDWFGVK